MGLGVGVMLTPSVNLVQSAFPEQKQGEISGLSRSVSNLGSSFGVSIAGTILVSNLVSGNGTYIAAMVVLAAVALAGFGIALRLPSNPLSTSDREVAAPAPQQGRSIRPSDSSPLGATDGPSEAQRVPPRESIPRATGRPLKCTIPSHEASERAKAPPRRRTLSL